MYKVGVNSIGQPFAYKIADQLFIPFDNQNSDYQGYLLWILAGNIPSSYP